MTASAFTRRQALRSGVLGVASLTIADRLLALGGNNEALAAMKPTLPKAGYGDLVHKVARSWRCRRASSTSNSAVPGR